MGYRSDGRMVFEGAKDEVLAIVADLKLHGDKTMHEALDDMTLWVDGERAFFALDYSDWKWYPSYPDIQAFERMWTAFSDASTDERDVAGAFVRVGEDPDDIERKYFGDDPYELVNTRVEIAGVDIPDKEQDFRNRPAKALAA